METDDYYTKLNAVFQNIENDHTKLAAIISEWKNIFIKLLQDYTTTNSNYYKNLLDDEAALSNILQKSDTKIKNIMTELQMKQLRLTDLEEEEASLNDLIKTSQNNIQDLEAVREKKSKKEDDFRQYLRDCVKLSKMMTCTGFNYQTCNIAGVISTKRSCKVFDINPVNMKQNDISNYMWQSLSIVSGEDWSDILDVE